VKEVRYSDSGSEHQVTLVVVLKYHGEKIVDTDKLELELLNAVGDSIAYEDGADDTDYHIMEASVDTVAHGSLHDFTKCPYCTGQSSHATEYCAIHGPIGE